MFIQIYKPSLFLSRYIKYYWVLETDSCDGIITERIIPTGTIQLMFHYRKPFICMTSENTEEKQSQSFLSGISSTYADVSTQGESGVIAVAFYPHGACHFFKFPLEASEERDIRLFDLIGNVALTIEQKLYESVTIAEKIQIIEDYLMKNFSEVKINDLHLICKAVNLIQNTCGQLQSAKLSKTLAVTQKSLERKFTSLVGKTPKQYSKIVRFQAILHNAAKHQNINLTQLALDFGYYDQAHFTKEFKSFSGNTPNDFFRQFPCRSDYFDK